MLGASERKREAYPQVRRAFERTATPQTGPAVVFQQPARVVGMTRYALAWFPILAFANANGALRQLTFGKHLPELRAHQLSTAIGSTILGKKKLLGQVVNQELKLASAAANKDMRK